jgi:maleylacetate reductase
MPASGIHRHQQQERVIYGTPAAAAVAAEVERVGAKRPFIVTSASQAKPGGLAGAIAAALGSRCAGQFAGVTAHSPRPSVIAGAAAAREARADLIVSVGGGSVVDAAKAMLLCLWQGIAQADELDAWRGVITPQTHGALRVDAADAVRILAVPTTLSAAEFTANAGISDPRRGVKESFGHPLFVPRSVVLDPAATIETPLWLLLSTGLRAVDHGVETVCSPNANPFADAMALHALRLLPDGLRRLKAEPQDMAARMTCQFGMWLSISGPAAGVTTGASHGIGHVLGAACGVPHGQTSCVMLPSVLRWNRAVNAERQRLVAAALGAADGDAADAVARLVADLGLPGRLADVGVGPDRFDEIAEKAMHDRSVKANPRPITSPAEVKEILRLAA